MLLGYYICPDRDKAVAQTHQFVTRHRPDVNFTEYSALGDVDEVSEVIQRYVDAGASKFRGTAPVLRRRVGGATEHYG